MKFYTTASILLLSLETIFLSCEPKAGEQVIDVSHIPINLEVQRLDLELRSLNNKPDIAAFLKKYPTFASDVLQIDQYPHDSIVVNFLSDFLQNEGSDTLFYEAEQVFGDFSELSASFSQAFQRIKYYYPDFEPPVIQTTITGFAGSDLFVSDSLIVIGLDYYLGNGATYRPLDVPQYILERYSKEYIVPSTILLLSARYNLTNYDDNSMMADMIYYGKAYYFSQQVLPESPDSVLIGYTGRELSDVQNNQDIIWSHFVENQLLYKTSHFDKQRYIDERPITQEIGPKCPGRIGVWLGWKIVEKYMSRVDDTSLQDLMSKENTQEIFNQSKYKPERGS